MEENQNQTKVPEFKPLTPGFDPMERTYTPYPCGEIYPDLEGVDRIRVRYKEDGSYEVAPERLNIGGYTYLIPKMKEEELSNLVSDGNIRPDYYNYAIEPVEYIHKNKLDFFQGNVVKYITRFREKNGLEDLRKAKTYIDLLIEKEYGKESNPCENGCKGCEKEQCSCKTQTEV